MSVASRVPSRIGAISVRHRIPSFSTASVLIGTGAFGGPLSAAGAPSRGCAAWGQGASSTTASERLNDRTKRCRGLGIGDSPQRIIPTSGPWCRLMRAILVERVMRVEPLPDIRDGVFVERFVKTLRDVADMRCCEDVVQRSERVRRRQRLDVENVNCRAGDLLVLQRANQSVLFDDRSARCIDQSGRWLHPPELRGPYEAPRTAAQ